jgi:phage terminase small subunit
MARYVAEGQPIQIAAKLAGYNPDSGGMIYGRAARPDFIEYVKVLQKQNERVSDMTRKRVMNGLLEAIEQAKLLSEPMTQVAGWREIAKMCGYYAPELKKIDINISTQRVMTQLETLSDADLLKMIETDADAIEGDARRLIDSDSSGDVAGPLSLDGSESSVSGDEEEAGAGESGAGPEESDSLRQAPLPELQGGVGA